MAQKGRIYIAILLIVFSSCEKEGGSNPEPVVPDPGHPWVTHLIRSGQHQSDLSGFHSFASDSLSFRLVFDSSAVYQTTDPQNQMDWNKVLGFADCGSFHHENSLRLGWRYHPQKGVEIGAYIYVDQQRVMESLGVVLIGDTLDVCLRALGNQYLIDVLGNTYVHSRSCSGPVQGYNLYPYFGGDETAPHDIRVHLQVRTSEWEY